MVDSGEAECYVSIDGAEPRMVKEYAKGESFGELALMYNSPRAATIKVNMAMEMEMVHGGDG